MPSGKLLRIAKNVVKNEPELFETLMEFERTKRIRTKTRLNFTIDKTVAAQFRKFCHQKNYNMSARIEQLMRDEIKVK